MEPRPTTWPYDLAAGLALAGALILGFAGPRLVGFTAGWQGTLVLVFLGVWLLGGLVFPIALGLAIGRRFGKTLWGGLAGLGGSLAVVVALFAWSSFSAPPATDDAALEAEANKLVGIAADELHEAVVTFAGEHGGRPPTRAELFKTKRKDGTLYLSGPVGGWLDAPPGAPVEPNGELVGVASHAKGQPYTTIGTTAMEGHPPLSGKYDYQTFGAVVYDADPAGKRWVVYGLGKLGALVSVERALDENTRLTP